MIDLATTPGPDRIKKTLISDLVPGYDRYVKCSSISWWVGLSCLLSFDPVGAQESLFPGTISLDSRLRYETAETTGKLDADNLSLRLRPGYLTPAQQGFQAMIEGEFTIVADEDSYHSGVSGDPDRAVIVDPQSEQLDQLWLQYTHTATALKLGRQVVAFDNHRWIGHVGWRQNRQTFDAATLSWGHFTNVKLQYGYIARANRIFGSEAPSRGGNAEDWDSDSHLIHGTVSLNDFGTLKGYGYLLDLKDAPEKLSGSETFGASYYGQCTVFEEFPLGVYVEGATQSDGGSNPNDYTADYFHGRLDTQWQGVRFEAGWEQLGSDQTGTGEAGNPTYAAVQTPLATAHAFSGFADRFLITPDRGLEDRYLMLGYTFDLGELGPLVAKVWWHKFITDQDSEDLGHEWDAVLVKPIPWITRGDMQFLAKVADFSGEEDIGDTERVSVELNYNLRF